MCVMRICCVNGIVYKTQFDCCWSMYAVDLNAVTRSLDLACKILSPPIAGAIMTYGSRLVSAIVIAAWNIVSLIAEYTILSHVYRLVPALSVKQSTTITGWLAWHWSTHSLNTYRHMSFTDISLFVWIRRCSVKYLWGILWVLLG